MKRFTTYLLLFYISSTILVRAQEQLNKESISIAYNKNSIRFKPEKVKLKLRNDRFRIRARGTFSDSKEQKADYTLEFSEDGMLLSDPPQQLIAGETIALKIKIKETEERKRVINLAERFLTTIKNLEENKKLFKDRYGIEDTTIDKYKKGFLKALNDVLREKSLSEEGRKYFERRIKLLGNITEDSYDKKIPKKLIAELLNPTYEIHCRFLNKGADSDIDTTFNLDSSNKYKGSIEANSAEIFEFELRRTNSLEKLIFEWEAFQKIDFPKSLATALVGTRKVINSKEFVEHQKELKKIVKELNNSDGKLDQAKCQRGIKLIDILKTQLCEYQLLDKIDNSAVQKWILNWLWLTEGVPKINPFDYQAIPMVPSEDIASLKNQLAYYDKLIENTNLQAEKGKELQKLAEKISTIKTKIDNYRPPNTDFNKDELLYKGELAISSPGAPVYMRHHNAKNDLLPMHLEPIPSITEGERMLVVTHNKDPKVKYIIDPIVKVIKDQSTLEEEFPSILKGFTTNIPEEVSYAPDLLEKADQCQLFASNYEDFKDSFNKDLNFIRSLQLGPTLPLKLNIDNTAGLESKIIYYEQPNPDSIPNVVSYPIKDTEGKELYRGSYRTNKLYRFRAKVGPMLSSLERRNYTITENEVTLAEERHQFDITAGVQFYLQPFNIRAKRFSYQEDKIKKTNHPWYYGSFIYLGLGLKKNPLENWLLGIGYEFYPGATVMVGGHFGVQEKLETSSEGTPYVRDAFQVGAYGSLAFDLSVFASFFGISGIFN